jgi:hypothetical protein
MVEIREALCEKFDQKEGLRKFDAGRHAEPRRWHGGSAIGDGDGVDHLLGQTAPHKKFDRYDGEFKKLVQDFCD